MYIFWAVRLIQIRGKSLVHTRIYVFGLLKACRRHEMCAMCISELIMRAIKKHTGTHKKAKRSEVEPRIGSNRIKTIPDENT